VFSIIASILESRLKERIRYADPICKEAIATGMEGKELVFFVIEFAHGVLTNMSQLLKA
jgi:hypothetical protein